MTIEPIETGAAEVPRPVTTPHWLRWVCTSNPFYVISAMLFLAGLRASFDHQAEALTTWGLMTGLTGYTLLLASTAFLLVRLGNVWDDVRTVLLLVVLMFLATSITFDEVLANDLQRGAVCYLGGLLFAVGVSEGLIRGLRLAFPWPVRGPYYLFLLLFFGYPLALSPILHTPELAVWGLFGFSTVAALVVLTLVPAVRRGAELVRDQVAPWRWPLYPWVLFGLLAAAVPVRAFLLCWSLHFLDLVEGERSIFGWYFLVPFALAGVVLLLEVGIVTGRQAVLTTALVAPLGVLALAVVGHREDAIYRGFLTLFTDRCGGDPLALTAVLIVMFYAYALARQVAFAVEGLAVALVLLAVVGPTPLTTGVSAVQPIPLAAAAALQLGFGLAHRVTWRCVLGTGGLLAVGALLPVEVSGFTRAAVLFHLAAVSALLIGAWLIDQFAHWLRTLGTAALVVVAAMVVCGWLDERLTFAGQVVYPLTVVLLVGAYGWWLRHLPALSGAVVLSLLWVSVIGWSGYHRLRQELPGIDYLVASLAMFGVAFLISAAKAGRLPRWLRWASA